MDIIEQYIKMCQAAKTDLWHPNYHFRLGSLFAHEGENRIAYAINWASTWPDLHGPIPIWQQDQLQDMIPKERLSSESEVDGKALRLHDTFNDWMLEIWSTIERDYLSEFDTLEQLWLAFVMHEKYNKIWDGEKWIPYKT